MLKITKTIINNKRSLIGFVLSGKEKEFGGFSNQMTETGVPLAKLVKDKFCNNQIAVVGGKIVEKNNFKINSLPMVLYTESGYVDVDNSVALLERFVQDNENVGFKVAFADGTVDNFRYENIIELCSWFKPKNFAIRTSSKGKKYIASKPGSPNLDELPATIIGEAPAVVAKKTKSAAKEAKKAISGELAVGFDVLDIYDFIKDCGGCVIKLPGIAYEAATEEGETITEGFTSLNIGEVASPTPMFNGTKINVNAGFKKVGVVPINIGGTIQTITTFVYRTKSLFLNGENYMQKFGIAVPVEKETALVDMLGRSLALEKITDPVITSPLAQVINVNKLAFYKVDSGKIDLISEDKRKASTMSSTQLVNLCKKQYDLKLISKALGPKGGLIKVLKDSIGADVLQEKAGKKPAGLFSTMNNEALEAISSAGIDIYSGAYIVPGKPVVKAASGTKSDESVSVEIEYTLEGYDAGKLTGAKIIDAVKNNDTTKVPETVIKIVGEILNTSDPVEQYTKAVKAHAEVEKKLELINKKFWMHNASMFLTGKKTNIHTHDAKKWVPDTKSKVKKGLVYMCTASGAEGLRVKFNGVII